jgi:hypothetical protein
MGIDGAGVLVSYGIFPSLFFVLSDCFVVQQFGI